MAVIFTVNSTSQDLSKQKFQLAETFEKDGNIVNAQSIYLDLYKEYPGRTEYFDGYVRTSLILEEHTKLLDFVLTHSQRFPSESLSILIAELQWKTGDFTSAVTTWDNILNKTKNYETFLNISFSQSKLRLYDKAVSTLLTGREKLQSPTSFSDELSSLYIITGDFKNGLNEIINAYLKRENNRNQSVDIRKEQIAQGKISALMNFPDAINYIDNKLNDISKDNQPATMRLYAWFLKSSGRLKDALEIQMKLDDVYQMHGGEVNEFATSCLSDGYYDIAIEGFRWVLAKGKDNNYSINSLYNLARALELKQLSMQAPSNDSLMVLIDNYRNVIEQYPESATIDDCRYNIARLYSRTKQYDEAIKEINILNQKYYNPATAAAANLLLGDIYLKSNKIDKAQKEYEKVVNVFRKYKSEYYKAKYQLAEIEYFTGNIDSAIAHFTDLTAVSDADVSNDALERVSLIEQNRNMNKALGLFAEAELKEIQDNDAAALSLYLESASALSPGNLFDICLISASDIELKFKKYFDAQNHLERIIKENQNSIYNDLVEFKLAHIAIMKGNSQEGILKLTDLIRKYPKSIYCEDSRKIINKLRQKAD